MSFSTVTVRSNGGNIVASWFNDLRTAGILTDTTALAGPLWTKYTVTYSQFSAAGPANNIELLSMPAKGIIHGYHIKHSTAFTGGTLTAYTLALGITGDLAKYAAPHDVFQAVGDTVFDSGSLLDAESHASATSIRVTATATGDNLDGATQGSADIWILRSTLP